MRPNISFNHRGLGQGQQRAQYAPGLDDAPAYLPRSAYSSRYPPAGFDRLQCVLGPVSVSQRTVLSRVGWLSAVHGEPSVGRCFAPRDGSSHVYFFRFLPSSASTLAVRAWITCICSFIACTSTGTRSA